MAKRDREKAGSIRLRKKGHKILAVKVQKKKKPPANTITIVLGVIGLVSAIIPKEEDKGDSRKTLPAIIGILDQAYMGCAVYWHKEFIICLYL